MRDVHSLPIVFTTHAALALLERFELSLPEVKHSIKTSRVVKSIEKDGNAGILQSTIGNRNIRFVCTIKRNTLVIITVEEC